MERLIDKKTRAPANAPPERQKWVGPALGYQRCAAAVFPEVGGPSGMRGSLRRHTGQSPENLSPRTAGRVTAAIQQILTVGGMALPGASVAQLWCRNYLGDLGEVNADGKLRDSGDYVVGTVPVPGLESITQ